MGLIFHFVIFLRIAGMPMGSVRTVYFFISILSAVLPLTCASAQVALPVQQPGRFDEQRRETSEMAVSIMVSCLACTCARFAEDIRNVVNDIRPGGMRVLPMLGVGGFQNIHDILLLRGVDMGTVDQDNLRLIQKKDPDLYNHLEQRIQYITKLYNAEFHVLARMDIASLADLEGKVVNFDLKGSQTQVMAENVFNMLKIKVQKSYFDSDQAIQKLAAREIGAMIVLTGAPQSALQQVRREDGFHFVPVSEASLPQNDLKPVLEDYLPAQLTADFYPNLIAPDKPVPTIGNRTLLAVYNWPEESERYRRIARFVQEFFSHIEQFRDKARHPKWKEINLAAEVPGWTRFKAAQDWLDGKRTLAAATPPASPTSTATEDIKAAFQSFLERYQASTGRDITEAEREQFFREFRSHIEAQAPRRAAR
jgi:uncharacterized protein